MEQGGWLDQILLFVLSVLANPWFGYGVALFGAAFVGYLARRSPKQDWEFIREWPGTVLLGAFFVSASLQSAPRLVFPDYHYSCDRSLDAFGLPTKVDCSFTSSGSIQTIVDYSFLDMIRDCMVAGAQELVLGAIGLAAGRWLAVMTRGPEAMERDV